MFLTVDAVLRGDVDDLQNSGLAFMHLALRCAGVSRARSGLPW